MPTEPPAGPRRRPRHHLRGPARAGLVLALALLTGGASAQSSPYFVSLSQSASHDSNLLRLGDGVSAPAGYSRSDNVLATSLTAGFDQGFGRQRGYGSIALRSTRFDANPVYDNESYSLAAGLDWSTIARISGTVNLGASRNLASFGLQELGLLGQRNFEDSRSADVALRVGIVTEWTAEATYGRREVSNTLDLPSVQSREFDSDAVSLGLRWRPAGATAIGLRWRGTTGRYPKFRRDAAGGFVEDRFRSDGTELNAELTPSGASRIALRIGSTRTRYDVNAARDFTGLTGSLEWSWRPTGKLAFVTSFSRTTGQDSTPTVILFFPATSDYSRVSRTLRLRTDWNVSAKALLYADVSRYERGLVRTFAVRSDTLEGGTGEERGTSWALGARWLPWRWLALGCEFNDNRQTGSGALGVSISSGGASCFAQVTAQ
jgi:hypothetical protein